MSVLVYRDRPTACAAAATLLSAGIIEKPNIVLGLDCAQELLPVYRTLGRMTADGLLEWSGVKVFQMYEHVRADADHSVEGRLGSVLLDKVAVAEENRYLPRMNGNDWSVVCNDYESEILNAGGIDTVFCAIRADGSIAYNLGGAELAPVTHVERTEEGRVVTVGIATIMAAKRIIAVMTGSDKVNAAVATFSGPIVPGVPASYLQLHRNAVFILDEDAAERI